MVSDVFIARPRLAVVASLVVTIAGLLCLLTIPVAQFPAITPPVVSITASYPGADAATIAQTVGAPLEQQVNGVEGMMYMSSTSSSAGVYTLAVTFEIGTDPQTAQINVQNRVTLAAPLLPLIVNTLGVNVQQQSGSMLGLISLSSDDPNHDLLFITNYAGINVQPALERVPGVSSASIFGFEYAMRIWLDVDKMTALAITTSDVSAAIGSQNLQASLGQIGAPPIGNEQTMQYTIEAKGRLVQPSEFEDIVLRSGSDGAVVRIRDVGRVELGAQSYAQTSSLNGHPAVSLAVYQRPSANALDVASGIRARLKELKQRFPTGLKAEFVYDSTSFVSASLVEIAKTLAITAVTVLLIVFVFLQDLRATVIPALAVPVSLVGVFIVFRLTGLSANTISLFALVLAIGLVVDDAIVVVENVQRVLEERGGSVREATAVAMRQVAGPIVSTTLVLFAIFGPVAFFPGITGELYRQFAITICAAVAISAFNALTLSPALCAVMLSAPRPHRHGAFGAFNTGFDRTRKGYVAVAGALARRSLVVGLLVLAAGIASGLLFTRLPTSFLPNEDQGVLFVDVALPDAAALPRTEAILKRVDAIARANPGVESVITVAGFSILTGTPSSSSGMGIIVLKPWADRTTAQMSLLGIDGLLGAEFAAIEDANVVAFSPPAILGLGSASGFDFRLEALAGQSPQEISRAVSSLVVAANQDPRIAGAFSTYSAFVPRLFLDLDRRKAETLGVSVANVFTTMQALLGSLYVNQFNYLGRTFQVYIQAEQRFRSRIDDIARLYVRNARGGMVPISTLAEVKERAGADITYQYNQYPSAQISGNAAPGRSSGEAMAAMAEAFGKTLPSGFDFEWSSLSFQEAGQTHSLTAFLFGLALLFGYLFLVALYESWTAPCAVIASVAVGALGAVLTVRFFALSNDIYVQIGLVLLVGLTAKNAILIVEYARAEQASGSTRYEAAVDGIRLRFRAVVMTALAFMIGLLPLIVSQGAGAVSRMHLGLTVLGGMLAATVLGILVIPALYVLFSRLAERGPIRSPVRGSAPTVAD